MKIMINQCILCKYKNNKEKCEEKIYEYNWHCPSLSNIWYGKMIKWFPFNIIQKIIDYFEYKKTEKFYEDFNEDFTENSTMKHIWGIMSYDDLVSKKCNLLSMNDIDLTYLKDEDRYILGVETAYCFKDHNAEKKYLEGLLERFTEFMFENNYNPNETFSPYSNMYEIFTEGYNINTKFRTVEDAYNMFRILVEGY